MIMKQSANRRIEITTTDRCRLGSLLADQIYYSWGNQDARYELEALLERATEVDSEDVPADLVTMNSTVRLSDMSSKKQSRVTLAYPDETDLVASSISVLSPLGLALLGRRVGQVIECPAGTGRWRARITDVVYQPESTGALHL